MVMERSLLWAVEIRKSDRGGEYALWKDHDDIPTVYS
jgi:hypothetical protein